MVDKPLPQWTDVYGSDQEDEECYINSIMWNRQRWSSSSAKETQSRIFITEFMTAIGIRFSPGR